MTITLTISAVIPLYNGAKFIESAIESVLEQTKPVAELIVVDDGSTDDGPAIVRRLAAKSPITLLHKPNGGQSSARNAGIVHAPSELVALLDQDDLWHPDHVEILTAPFVAERTKPLGWVYGNANELGPDGNVIDWNVIKKYNPTHPKLTLADCIGRDMYVAPSGTIYRRSAVLEVGGFDERLSGYEDDDLCWRMFVAGYANEYIDRSVFGWRMHPDRCSYSPRIRQSRSIYARKLLDAYIAGPNQGLIVERMFKNWKREVRLAMKRRDAATALHAVSDGTYLVSRTGSLAKKIKFKLMGGFLGNYTAIRTLSRLKLLR